MPAGGRAAIVLPGVALLRETAVGRDHREVLHRRAAVTRSWSPPALQRAGGKAPGTVTPIVIQVLAVEEQAGAQVRAEKGSEPPKSLATSPPNTEIGVLAVVGEPVVEQDVKVLSSGSALLRVWRRVAAVQTITWY
jgi:hypothetical protein